MVKYVLHGCLKHLVAFKLLFQLQTGTLDLSLNIELELRALQQNQIALDSDLTRLKHEVGTTSEKANTTEDAVNTLEADLGVSNAKHAKLETDLKTQTEKMTEVEKRLQKVLRLSHILHSYIFSSSVIN